MRGLCCRQSIVVGSSGPCQRGPMAWGSAEWGAPRGSSQNLVKHIRQRLRLIAACGRRATYGLLGLRHRFGVFAEKRCRVDCYGAERNQVPLGGRQRCRDRMPLERPSDIGETGCSWRDRMLRRDRIVLGRPNALKRPDALRETKYPLSDRILSKRLNAPEEAEDS
jgi:hypothetical protein